MVAPPVAVFADYPCPDGGSLAGYVDSNANGVADPGDDLRCRPPRPNLEGRVRQGGTLWVHVPEAVGGRTVLGQLTTTQGGGGFFTAYACANGIPQDQYGGIGKSDLNYDVGRGASNRLMVRADAAGNVCVYTNQLAHMVVDIFGVTDSIDHFAVRRFSTRDTVCLSRRPDGSCAARTDPPPPAFPVRGAAPVPAGSYERINVPEAAGGLTVIGQLTATAGSDGGFDGGFVTAYGCAEGIPRNGQGGISKSDLNLNQGRLAESNRLVVTADAAGDICIFTSAEAHITLGIFGATDDIEPLPPFRMDTRGSCVLRTPVECVEYAPIPGGGSGPRIAGGTTQRLHVPAAVGGQTVVGQLTMAQSSDGGFFTAYGCADGLPRNTEGGISKSDLNFEPDDEAISNRLLVQADAAGDVCVYTNVDAHIIVDVVGVTDDIDVFANRRTDTRPTAPVETGR